MESMTGYGRSEISSRQLTITAEAKSVNNRYLDIRIRMPSELNPYELDVRRLARDYFARGSIQIGVVIEDIGKAEVRLNRDAARHLVNDLHIMKEELALSGEVNLDIATRFLQITQGPEKEIDQNILWQSSRKAVKKALEALKKSRRREGDSIKRNIKLHFKNLSSHIRSIRRKAPDSLQQFKKNIEERAKELIDIKHIDDQRLEEEAALLATRRDINEELSRLEIHLASFQDVINQNGPIGRNLEFLTQEILRELNTVAAKTPAIEINRLTVIGRVELEKIKEQVYNIE